MTLAAEDEARLVGEGYCMLPEDKQDASIRMGLYLLNYLQYNYIDQVDMPFARRDIDAVLASVQQWLNALVNAGQLHQGHERRNQAGTRTRGGKRVD